jgi:hypothetical protein
MVLSMSRWDLGREASHVLACDGSEKVKVEEVEYCCIVLARRELVKERCKGGR